MKIAYKETESFLRDPKAYRSCLFFGPDNGLARERAKMVLERYVTDKNDPFAITSLDNAAIADEPSLLFDALSALSLLGDAPVVFVRDASDDIASIISEAHKSAACQNHLVCIAGELGTNSALRRFFETNKQAAAVGCYREDAGNIRQLMSQKLQQAGVSVEPQIIAMLANKLGNDRAVSMNEIEKLITYAGAGKKITLHDANDLIQLNDDKNVETLYLAIADGKVAQANILIERLLQEGNEPVGIFRQLQRFFQRLLIVQGHIQQGLSVEIAMKKLQPPVFFKLEQSFKQHIKQLSGAQLLQISSKIHEAERDAKRAKDPLALCLRTVSSLCLLVKQRH